MKITKTKHVATVEAKQGAIKQWKRNPSDQLFAARAAHHCARRDGETMVLFPGNSFGSSVYHIVREDGDYYRYAIAFGSAPYVKVGIVDPDGKVWEGTAEAE